MEKTLLKIIEFMALNCRLSNQTIAKSLNLSKDTIRNKIKYLEDNHFLTPYNTILDLRKVGISKFHILLKFEEEIQNKQEIIKKILANPESISFANTFIGKYDLQLIIDTKDIYTFEKIKKEILEKTSNYIRDCLVLNFVQDIKHSNLIPEITLYTKFEKQLDSSFSSIMKYPTFEAGEQFKQETMDDLDLEILKELCNKPKITLVELSKRLKYNRETIKNRIIKLIRNKIILNFGANPNFEKFNYTTYYLLIKTKESLENKRIKEAIAQENNIFYSAKLQGNYSIIIYLLAKTPQELRKTIENIRKEIGKDILELEVLIFDGLHHYKQLPEQVVKELKQNQ